MPHIALKRLTFGDGFIEPGQEVPLEPGRDYAQMERHGEIVWSELPAAAHAVQGATEKLESAAKRRASSNGGSKSGSKRAPAKGTTKSAAKTTASKAAPAKGAAEPADEKGKDSPEKTSTTE